VASLEEYLRGAPVSGRQASEYEKLVKSLQTYGSTANTAAALGIPAESTNPAIGALDFLLSPERGVLTAPARAIRTTIAGPEAAAGFGSAGSLRVQEDDNPFERAGKLASAFVLDVATDPISYIGAPTSIGRAGVSKIATSLGGSTLKSLSKAANIPESTLVEKLAERSRVGQAAKLQEEAGIVDDSVASLPSNLYKKNKTQYAEAELGNILGESLYTRGRRGVVADLARVARLAGADEETATRAARQVFSELPSEVQGGLRFMAPFGGTRASARIAPAGSTGVLESAGLGAVADVANRARLGIASTIGAPATRYLSGQTGPILQGAKRGARSVAVGEDGLPVASLGRPTILDWSQFGKEVTNRDQVLFNLQRTYMSPLYVALQTGKTIGQELGEQGQQQYNELLFQGLSSAGIRPAAGVPANVVQQAQEQATNIRTSLNALRDELNDAGFEIGDLSPDFFPLMFTPEAARVVKQTARSGRVSTGYSGAGGRKFGFKVVTDPEEGDEFGFLIEGFQDVYAANPKEASKRLAERLRNEGYEGVTEDSFISDPIAAMTSYVNVMTQKLSTKRFADSLAESGLLVKDVSTTVQRLNDRAINTLASTLKELRPTAAKNIEQAVQAARDELAKNAAGATGVAARLSEEVTNAEAAYNAAKAAEESARKAASEAREAFTKAKMTPREAVSKLREYSESGATVGDVAEARRVTRNAQARAGRAEARATREEAALEELETMSAAVQGRLDNAELVDQADTAMDSLLSAEDARLFATAAKEFSDTLAAARVDVEGRISADILGKIDDVARAALRQAETADAYANATLVRRATKETRDRLRNAKELTQIDSIRVVAENYHNARAAVTKARNSGNAAAIADAERAEGAAFEVLKKVLSDNPNLTGPVGKYAAGLQEVIEKLTRAELDSATVLASEDKLRRFVESAADQYKTPEEIDAVFTDMVETYTIIRDKITPEQLDLLSPQQRSIFESADIKTLGKAAADRLTSQGVQGVSPDTVIGFGIDDVIKTSKERSEFGKNLSKDLRDPNAALHPIGGAFEDMYAPLEIKQSLDQLYDMTRRPTEWQRKIEDYLDPALLLWRLQVTQLRGPAYTLLNLSGGTFNNIIGNVSLANSFISAKTVKAFIEAERQISKEFPGVPDLAARTKIEARLRELVGKKEYEEFEAFLTRGGSDTSSTVEQIRQASMLGTEVSDIALTRRGSRAIRRNEPSASKAGQFGRSAVDWVLTNRVSGFLSDVNQTTETYLRYAAFKQGVQNFNNYDAAMDLSMALHFNYADLSQAERWVRRVVPFYTWMRNNIPLQVRTMFLQPSKMTKFMYAREEIENAYGDEESWMKMLLPEYAQISGGFAVKVGDNRLFFVDRLPYQDLNTMFQVGGFPVRLRNVAGSIGPAGGLYGAIAGVDTGTGRAFDPAGTPAPMWARPLSPLLPKNAQGEALIPEAVNAIVNETVPFLGTVERAAGALLPEGIAPSSQTDRRLSNFLNLVGAGGAAGQSIGTLTPAVARGELRRRQIALSNSLISAAEQANVDLDWVREQLRGGATPEQVYAAIAAGYGRSLSGASAIGSDRLDFEKQQALQNMLSGM